VRNLEASIGKSHDASFQNAKPLHTGGFLAGFEEKLVAEADAEVGTTRERPFADGIPQPGSAEVLRTMRKGSHAGDNYGIQSGEAGGPGHKAGRRPSGFESLADASKVAAAIVNDAEFFPTHKTPFVLGMP
jgi:hypothetical protein